MKGRNSRRICGRGILLCSDECEVINRRKTKLVHAFGGSVTSGLNGGREVIKMEKFIGVARNVESEAGDLLETLTWVVRLDALMGQFSSYVWHLMVIGCGGNRT